MEIAEYECTMSIFAFLSVTYEMLAEGAAFLWETQLISKIYTYLYIFMPWSYMDK
jgi:hypothetical protein